jgi:hypothetical protein
MVGALLPRHQKGAPQKKARSGCECFMLVQVNIQVFRVEEDSSFNVGWHNTHVHIFTLKETSAL